MLACPHSHAGEHDLCRQRRCWSICWRQTRFSTRYSHSVPDECMNLFSHWPLQYAISGFVPLPCCSSPPCASQVASQPGLAAGTKVQFTGELFQPVPWSPSTKHGMPQVRLCFCISFKAPSHFVFVVTTWRRLSSRLGSCHRRWKSTSMTRRILWSSMCRQISCSRHR